jgi:hypothetical protein
LRRRSHDPLSAILKDLIKTKILDEAQSNQTDDIENIVPVLITNSKIVKKDDNIFIAGTSINSEALDRVLPREPDANFLRLWLKNEHGGNYLTDHSKCDNIVELHAKLNEETQNSVEPKLRKIGTQDFGITPDELANETTGNDNQYIRVLDNPNIRIKEIATTSEGFSVFCRIYVPVNWSETLNGIRSTLFSKLDTEQVDYAFLAQLSDTGDVYFFVRNNNVEKCIKCTGCLTFLPKFDFLDPDYNSIDYEAGPVNQFPIPTPVPFTDLVFTFKFSNNRMTIIKDGMTMVDSTINGYTTTAPTPFPAYQDDPPPIPPTPVPVTNPIVNFYNNPLPAVASQTATKLHLKGFTTQTQIYNVTDGASHVGGGTSVTPIVTQYNVQVVTQGGGVGGSVYDLAGTNHHTDITLDGTDLLRVGMLVETGSTLIGKTLVRIVVRLRTEGTSPTGSFKVGIRKANDTFLQFGSTVNVTTMVDDSTDRDFTFDLLTNSYPLAVGDRITIETTDIANGHLGVKKDQGGNIPNMTWQTFGTSSWSNESGYQLSGTFYESGTTQTPTAYNGIWYDANTFASGVQVEDVIYVSAANSPLVGKTITSVVVTAKRATAAVITGNLVCKIDNVQLGSAIDISTLTQSDSVISFTDRNFANALVNGSKIKLVLTSGTGTSSTNTVQFKHTLSDAFVGANEQIGTYNWPGGISYSNSTVQDLIGTLESGGKTVTDPSIDPWLELDDSTKRVVVYVNASSLLIGKLITKLTTRLSASGAPTGTISVNIRNSADAIVGTLGTLDSTLLTASIQSKDFVNVGQPRTLSLDDRICIEYGGGNATNFVKVAVQLNIDAPNQNAYDTTRTLIKTWNGSTYLTTISSQSANGFDLSGQMYIGGAISDPTGRTRIGEICTQDLSILKGRKLTRATVYLQKIGTLIGVNDIAVRIRKGSDDSIASTIGLFSSGNVATASPTAYTFTNFNQQYAIQIGDKVTVEFNGGDDANYIKVIGTTTDIIDSTKSYLVDFDDLIYRNITTSDLVGTFDYGGDTYTPAADEIPPPRDPFYTHDLNILAGGYPWAFISDTEQNPVGPNVLCDFRFERQIFTTQMALNLKNNGCSTSNILPGKVSKVGYFAIFTGTGGGIGTGVGNFDPSNFSSSNFDTG